MTSPSVPTQIDLYPLPEIPAHAGLHCPMPPGCGADLYVFYESLVDLSGADFNEVEPPHPSNVSCMTWRVECESGHVLLLPGPIDVDDKDHVESDECRRFGKRDMQRLRAVLKSMNIDWEKINVE